MAGLLYFSMAKISNTPWLCLNEAVRSGYIMSKWQGVITLTDWWSQQFYILHAWKGLSFSFFLALLFSWFLDWYEILKGMLMPLVCVCVFEMHLWGLCGSMKMFGLTQSITWSHWQGGCWSCRLDQLGLGDQAGWGLWTGKVTTGRARPALGRSRWKLTPRSCCRLLQAASHRQKARCTLRARCWSRWCLTRRTAETSCEWAGLGALTGHSQQQCLLRPCHRPGRKQWSPHLRWPRKPQTSHRWAAGGQCRTHPCPGC